MGHNLFINLFWNKSVYFINKAEVTSYSLFLAIKSQNNNAGDLLNSIHFK